MVGHTQIKSGIISSKFETLPDAPITSVVVTLPVGPRSLVAANGNLCRASLLAPTTLIAQSGAKINRKTKIAVTNCPVEVIAQRTTGNKAILTVLVPAAGRLSVSGRDVHPLRRRVSKAGKLKLTVQLNSAGVARRHSAAADAAEPADRVRPPHRAQQLQGADHGHVPPLGRHAR